MIRTGTARIVAAGVALAAALTVALLVGSTAGRPAPTSPASTNGDIPSATVLQDGTRAGPSAAQLHQNDQFDRSDTHDDENR